MLFCIRYPVAAFLYCFLVNDNFKALEYRELFGLFTVKDLAENQHI